jgi:hypothetical protein
MPLAQRRGFRRNLSTIVPRSIQTRQIGHDVALLLGGGRKTYGKKYDKKKVRPQAIFKFFKKGVPF